MTLDPNAAKEALERAFGPAEEEASLGPLFVARQGDVSRVALELTADEEGPHLCASHVHVACSWPGAMPRPLHRKGQRAEVFVPRGGRLKRLGGGPLDMNRTTDAHGDRLAITFHLDPAPAREMIVALGLHARRRMFFLGAGKHGPVTALPPSIDAARALASIPSMVRPLALLRRGGERVHAVTAHEAETLLEHARGDSSDWQVVVHAQLSDLVELAVLDQAESVLARFETSYRESCQLAHLGVAVRGEHALAAYYEHKGVAPIYAEGAADAPSTTFLCLAARHQGRSVRPYTAAAPHVVGAEHALAGLREYLCTGHCGPLSLPGFRAHDRDAGLPLVTG